MVPHDTHLTVGSLLFDDLDQIDLTGPIEVLAALPNATHRIYATSREPVRSLQRLRIVPDATLDEAPPLDVLHVPGGRGQEALMADEAVLGWLRRHRHRVHASSPSARAPCCSGRRASSSAVVRRRTGRRSTSCRSSGAVPVDARVVIDGDWVFAAGITAGIDGALRLAAEPRGERAAQRIRLDMAYAPEPPFSSGTPESAPPEVLASARAGVAELIARREATAKRAAQRLGTMPV